MQALLVVAKKLGMKIAQAIVMSGAGQGFFKFLLYVVLGLLVVVLLLMALPFVGLMSLPTLFMNAHYGTENALDDMKMMNIYQTVPNDLVTYIDNQIQSVKDQNTDVDEFRLSKSSDVTWEMLMSIDAGRYKQTFKNISYDDVMSLAKRFVYVSSVKYTETRTEIQYVEEEVTEVIIDEEGRKNKITYTSVKPVEVEIEVVIMEIEASSRTFESVLEYDFDLDDEWDNVAKQNYATLLNFDLEGALNIYDSDIDLSNLKEYPPGDSNVIYYNQTDSRWGPESYGSSTIASAGCGPTSLSMVIHSLSDSTVTPKTIADWSVANGHRCEGSGSYWSLIKAGGEAYGLKVTQVGIGDMASILEALSMGKPVIAIMGKGHFTNGGHFIVLRGLTADGNILINDPNSVKRSEIAWNPLIVFTEAKNSSGDAFWILEKKE